MGKRQNAIYSQLLAAINKLQNQDSNPAQKWLTNEALAGADWLKKGEFSSLPKGMFFDFQNPAEQMKQYQKYANVSADGTYALGDGSGSTEGRSAAQGLQSKYLKDKFARDASQNYQNNITGAANNIRGALGGAANASAQNSQQVISALSGLYGSPALNRPSGWGSVLGMIGGLGSSALGGLKL